MSTIREYENVISQVIVTSQDPTYLVTCPGSTTATVEITLNENVQGILSDGVKVAFADTNPDTITRDKGSWIDDNFEVGMTVTFTGTVSNNAGYLITAVTDDTLTTSDAVTVEALVEPASAIGDIAEADWFVHETIAALTHTFTYLESGPTGIRVKRASGTGNVRVWVRS